MVFQQHINVLSGEKLQALGVGQFQIDTDNIVRQVLQLVDPARQCPHLNIFCSVDFAHLDGQVTDGMCLAEQHFALRRIGIRQRVR